MHISSKHESRAIWIGLGLLSAVIVLFGFITLRDQASIQSVGNIQIPKVYGSDPKLGSNSPKVQVLVYGDFQCPFCKNSVQLLQGLLGKYPNDLQIVWKDLPLTTLHPQALSAAIAANCAHRQGKFWEMHEELFSSQNGLSAAVYEAAASALQLDVEKFGSCLNSGDSLADIQKTVNDAAKAGIDSLPTYVINDTIIEQTLSQDQLETYIQRELNPS